MQSKVPRRNYRRDATLWISCNRAPTNQHYFILVIQWDDKILKSFVSFEREQVVQQFRNFFFFLVLCTFEESHFEVD